MHAAVRHWLNVSQPLPARQTTVAQSAIGYPAHNEVVPLGAGTYAVRGYAYCGGSRAGGAC